MILVSIFGGLGNQMFQYACGKAIATKLNLELKLDISHVIDRTPRKDFTFRKFELGVFNIKEEVATIKEVRQFIPDLWNSKKYVKLLYRLKRLLNGNSFFNESLKFIYNKDIEFVSDNTYLYGYFQTEKYFENVRNELLQCFSLINKIDILNQSLIKQIKSEDSVSIHVRRGDYINSPFNLLDIYDYYKKAIELIQEKVDSPVFYIFTNDLIWVEENFSKININKNFINFNTEDQSFLDMILMSNCKHNICANSSFSWWGAWLNKNPQKIVITPKAWFKNPEEIESTYDLIPTDWLII